MHRIDIIAALAAIAAAILPAPAFAQTPHETELYEAAKKEPGGITWYNSILDQQMDETVAQAFAAKYPGLRVTPVKTTAQVAFQRLLQDLKAGQVQSDVFTTTDIGQMVFLKSKGNLLQYTPDATKQLAEAVRTVDPEGFYHTGWVGLIGLCYNTSKVKPADAPTDWPGLADARWKNQLAFGSPNFSGMVGVWTVAMAQRYGWDYFEKLNGLNPLVGRSIDDSIAVLNSGERSMAMCNPATAERSAAKGNPVAAVYPSSGTVMVIAPSGIIKGTTHPNTAKLFMEFLAGPEYSQILSKVLESPLRGDVPPPPGRKSLADMNLFAPTPAQIVKDLPSGMSKWRDTFGM